MLIKLEFYNAPDGQVCVKPADGAMFVLDESQRDIIPEMLLEIQSFWPESFKRLSELYSASSLNRVCFEFRMVRRFCRCNFGIYDTMTWDIDQFGEWHFEQVPCPLRGECPHEGVICCPKLKTKLSEREMEVAKLLSHMSPEEITAELSLSIRTVYNHVQAIKVRLKLKTIAQIAAWYKSHNQ
jgi:DNA-binding CsgD family transcriptional regulator